MVDQSEIDRLEREFTAYLILGSDVAENRFNDKQRAGTAYRIEDRDGLLVKQKSEYIGEAEKYTADYVEYEALLNGIKDIKLNLPAGAIDLRIRTANATLNDQLSGNSNPYNTRGMAKLAEGELNAFRAWEIEKKSEAESDRIQSTIHSAEASFRGGGTEFAPGLNGKRVKLY